MSAERDQFVEEQLLRRGIVDERVLNACRDVPRDAFVPANLRSEAYADHPLPIFCGQTISQPFVVARMTELLALDGSERVLEIGTGSGYQTAILAQLCRQVYSIEQHALLSEQASEVFQTLKYDNISLRVGDGTLGWPEEAPFDAIIVTAAGPDLPAPLLEQLVVGGRLVAPIGSRYQQELIFVRHDETHHFERSEHGLVRFVPLIGAYGW